MYKTYLIKIDASTFFYTFPNNITATKMKMRYCSYKAPASSQDSLLLLNFSIGAPKKYNNTDYTYLLTSIPDQKIVQESSLDDWVDITFSQNVRVTVMNEFNERVNDMNPIYIELVFQ